MSLKKLSLSLILGPHTSQTTSELYRELKFLCSVQLSVQKNSFQNNYIIIFTPTMGRVQCSNIYIYTYTGKKEKEIFEKKIIL